MIGPGPDDMRYLALVTDYDGTLAADDRVFPEAMDALRRVRSSGRRSILITGRCLDDLFKVCDCASLFDLIVAENGAILFDPVSREEIRLANPPPKLLLRGLRARGIEPLEVGQVVIAMHAPHRQAAQDVVWELGLEVQVIGNRGMVMLLPPGVNKATGLEHALRRLGLSRHEVVGVGDAENDHSFLQLCEAPVAVANALDSVKEQAVLVTAAANGRGVVELIDELIANDLKALRGKVARHLITIGTRPDGSSVQLAPHGHNVLVAGPSGSGKSTLTAAILERLIEKDYQVCIVDPEGDYGTLPGTVALGNQWRAPSVTEILSILEDPQVNISINLLGLALEDRPEFFSQLIPNLQALRARTGRPHWIVLDEAHHMLPDNWGHASSTMPRQLGETLLVTVHPDHVAPEILAAIDLVVAVGHSQQKTLEKFARVTGRTLPWPEDLVCETGRTVAWYVDGAEPPFVMRPVPARAERIRHQRKYAEGDLRLGSFYFRGPGCRHNLKAQNLAVFCQMAGGIDEETWMYHLRRGDYSRWLRYSVRDDFLADEVERIERRPDVDPWQSRRMITELTRSRYTLPE